MIDINNIYIHIPFCDSICGYCDFTRELKKQEVEDKYIDKLVKEINEHNGVVKTLFIGGGTPSCISKTNMNKLFSALSKLKYSNKYEATIECNPSDIDDELIDMISNSIINRVSIGVQSFVDDELKYLQRSHSSTKAVDAIRSMKKSIDNVSIDIMYGFKGHNIESIKNTIKIIKELNIEHVSFYNLIIKPGSKFYKESNHEDEKVMDEIKSINFLNNYEIANYSKQGMECKHNLAIWNYEDFIAYGYGGHSKINNDLYSNNGNSENWTREILEKVDTDESFKNEIILGLRLTKGITKDRDVIKHFKDVIDQNIKYFDINNTHIKVKQQYQDRLNEVLMLFV